MKKLLIGAICSLFLLTSMGCSNSKQSQSTDNTPKSSQVKKHNSKHKSNKKHNKTKTADKKKKSDKKAAEHSKQQDNQQPNTQQSAAPQSQQQTQPQNNQTSQQQNSNGISYDTNTLTGFLNTYGMSPVAYKIKNGMSPYNALKSTPNSMKTSGEMQTEYAMDQGYIDHNGNEVQQPAHQDQSDSYDTQTDGY